MVWFRNNKVIKFALVTLEVSSEHHRSVQSTSQVVKKSHTFDCLLSQKENVFHLTFLVSQQCPTSKFEDKADKYREIY